MPKSWMMTSGALEVGLGEGIKHFIREVGGTGSTNQRHAGLQAAGSEIQKHQSDRMFCTSLP